MNELGWYSARLKLVCQVEGELSALAELPVYLLRARSFEEAFDIALDLGKQSETTYVNHEGRQVRWSLFEVVSLDRLPVPVGEEERFDRLEISSSLRRDRPEDEYLYDHVPTPDRSEPINALAHDFDVDEEEGPGPSVLPTKS